MKTKEALITEILQVCQVSNISTSKCPVTGELSLGLACASLEALQLIAHELYIPIK